MSLVTDHTSWVALTGLAHQSKPSETGDALLTRREQALVGAVADAFFPPGGPIPLSGSEAGIVRYFDGYVRRSEPRQRILIRLLFAFTELSPLLFGPQRRPFTQLKQADRLTFLASASQSRIYFRRVAFVSFRALMTMAYLGHPEVAQSLKMRADTDPFGLGGEAS